MTNGKTTVLETDVIIFPMEFRGDDQETKQVEEQSAASAVEKQPMTDKVKIRFARFRKSLRKRSAGIL